MKLLVDPLRQYGTGSHEICEVRTIFAKYWFLELKEKNLKSKTLFFFNKSHLNGSVTVFSRYVAVVKQLL
jgi:hypothetical protein